MGTNFVGLGRLLQDAAKKQKKRPALFFDGNPISYAEVEEASNKVANGLKSLGVRKGDRVAIMLPNIPEFVYTLFGIEKLGAVAVPFNTLYKGREITHILNDSGAVAIVALTNFASLLNEVRDDCPDLRHVITTGERTLVFVEPGSTANIQAVFEKTRFESPDAVFRFFGETLLSVIEALGVKGAFYKHRGSIRCRGKKLATIVLQEIENLYVVNGLLFSGPLNTDEFFRVLWVPAEIKDKVVEPSTSLQEELGRPVSMPEFRDLMVSTFQETLGTEVVPGELKRDEIFGYEKNRALASRR